MTAATTTHPTGTAIPEAALAELRELLGLYDRFNEQAFRGRQDAVDLSQLTEALRCKDAAQRTWVRVHNLARGVAGVLGTDEDTVIRAADRRDGEQ
jgi:hypothetical protein